MVITPANWAEIIAAVISSACVLYKPSVLNRWFVWFLWLTISVELNGKLSVSQASVKYPIYNVFTLLEFLFYSGFFYQVTASKQKKGAIKFTLFPVVLFFAANLFFIEGTIKYNGLTRCLALLILMIYCLFHYVEIAQSERIKDYKWSLFVIVTGCFIFFAGNLVLSVYFNYILQKKPDALLLLYKAINHNLVIFLYAMLSLGLLLEVIESRTKKVFLSH
jgi:hypothetical protein